jgi:hypothetical protein
MVPCPCVKEIEMSSALKERLASIERKVAAELKGILVEFQDRFEEVAKEKAHWPFLIATANMAGVSCEAMADSLGLSKASFEQWRDGRSVPDPKLGSQVLSYLHRRFLRAE